MRRGTRALTNYLEWLKSIGCVFYAPLKDNMKDLISETEGVLNGTMKGFNENGMNFQNNVLHWDNPLWFRDIDFNESFTFLFDYLKTGQSGHATLFNSWDNLNTSTGILVECNANSKNTLGVSFTKTGYIRYSTVVFPNSGETNTKFWKCGVTYDGNGTMTRIHNGKITEYTSFTSEQNFPDMSNCVFAIGGSTTYDNDKWFGTIGNVYFFKKSLTDKEIEKL